MGADERGDGQEKLRRLNGLDKQKDVVSIYTCRRPAWVGHVGRSIPVAELSKFTQWWKSIKVASHHERENPFHGTI